jgi:hypothetical protein
VVQTTLAPQPVLVTTPQPPVQTTPPPHIEVPAPALAPEPTTVAAFKVDELSPSALAALTPEAPELDRAPADSYFAGDDQEDGDLLLTIPASEEEESRQVRPSNGGAEIIAAFPLAAVELETGARRPSWQHPAATIATKPWPSISGLGTDSNRATVMEISDAAVGTATPARRSWWRRSFTRAK